MILTTTALLLMLAALSKQDECFLEVHSSPYSSCSDTNWGKVTFIFEENGPIYSFLMADVCVKGGMKRVPIILSKASLISKGYLMMKQADNGPVYLPTYVPSTWFIDRLILSCPGIPSISTFVIMRGILTSRWYNFSNFDTSVPINSSLAVDQSMAEVGTNRINYERTPLYKDGPFMVKKLGKADFFEMVNLYKTGPKFAAKVFAVTASKKMIPDLMKGPKFNSIAELDDFIARSGYPIPEPKKFWKEDSWFAAQRVQGPQPRLLKPIASIPKDFKVDKVRVQKLIGENLDIALSQNRVFLTDLDILRNVENFYAPMALFVVDPTGEDLKPVAIQLEISTGEVFYADDDKAAWLLAKMYYNNAESNLHQSVSHFSDVHGLMDGIASLVQQHLPPSHPIYKLLKPHFHQMFGTNQVGSRALLQVNGTIDIMSQLKVDARTLLVKIGSSRYDYRRMDIFWDFEFNRNTDKIKNYPYRERALTINEAIYNYVENIVKNYYADDVEISKDVWLKNWRMALGRKQELQGAGIKNLPGVDKTGHMFMADLINVLNFIVWTASVGHTTAHTQLYYQSGYPLNYPNIMPAKIPRKKDITDQHLIDAIPDKKAVLANLAFFHVLMEDGGAKSLGYFERQFLYAPKDLQAIESFRKSLEKISKMKFSNLKYSYNFLDVDKILNAPNV